MALPDQLWTPSKRRVRRPTLRETMRCSPLVGRQDSSGGGFFDMQPTILPTDINGLVLWLRADLGITAPGGSLTAWADQSGKKNNTTNATSPTWHSSGGPNNNPYIVCTADTSTEMITGTVTALSVPFEYFVAGKSTSSANCTLIDFGNYFYATANYTAGAYGIFLYSGAALNNPSYVINQDFICNAQANAASSVLSVRQSGTRTVTGNPDSGNVATTTWTIGGYGGGGSSWGGNLYEVIAFNKLLSAADRSNVMNYMSTFWGIQ